MSRLEATQRICFRQMRYENDTLRMDFPKMKKKDQIGLNKDSTHHFHSNPLMPTICSLTALTSDLFLIPKDLDGL